MNTIKEELLRQISPLPVGARAVPSSGLSELIQVKGCGAVAAKAWPVVTTVDGEAREYLQVELTKTYKDRAGKWRSISKFWPEDLPAVVAVAERAARALRVSETWPAEPSDDGQADAEREGVAEQAGAEDK